MSSSSDEHLVIEVAYNKPNLGGDGRGGVKLSGTSNPRTEVLLDMRGVGKERAEEIVAEWRRLNPDLKLVATWRGPTTL